MSDYAPFDDEPDDEEAHQAALLAAFEAALPSPGEDTDATVSDEAASVDADATEDTPRDESATDEADLFAAFASPEIRTSEDR